MVYDGGIVSFLSAFVIITASLIVAGTAKSVGHLDLWGIEGNNDKNNYSVLQSIHRYQKIYWPFCDNHDKSGC